MVPFPMSWAFFSTCMDFFFFFCCIFFFFFNAKGKCSGSYNGCYILCDINYFLISGSQFCLVEDSRQRSEINIQFLLIVKCFKHAFAILKKEKPNALFIFATIHVVFFHLFVYFNVEDRYF